MANRMNAAKRKVRKNDKSRFERIVRHRQVLTREKYVEKGLARTCNIYFICAILSIVLAVAGCVYVFVSPNVSILVLALNLAFGILFVPLCLYQNNQYQHMAKEVSQARQSSKFRFPEDYTPRTRKTREKFANEPKGYAINAVEFGLAFFILGGVTAFCVGTGKWSLNNTGSLLIVVVMVVVLIILLVMFIMAIWNFADAIKLRNELIEVEKDAEAEFGVKLPKGASIASEDEGYEEDDNQVGEQDEE